MPIHTPLRALSLLLFVAISATPSCNNIVSQGAPPPHSVQLTPERQADPPSAPESSAQAPSSRSSSAIQAPRGQQLSLSQFQVNLTLVFFDDRSHCLLVADQENGPASQWRHAQEVAQSHQAIAVINGGYFTPEGKPLGLLSQGGKKRGSFNHSSLGSAFYLASGRPSLITSQEFQRLGSQPADFLQAGPRLVWNGQKVSGLKGDERRPRSFLAWDGQHQWMMGYADATTLDQLAQILSSTKFDNFTLRHAFNLDGGRSSELWVSPALKGQAQSRRSLFYRPARNYLVLKSSS